MSAVAQEAYEAVRVARVARRGRILSRILGTITLAVLAGWFALPLAALVTGAGLTGRPTPWIGLLLGGLVAIAELAPSGEEIAWRRGAAGEREVMVELNNAIGRSGFILDDVHLPDGDQHVAHVVITPGGVWSLDVKLLSGRVEAGGSGTELWIGGRNRSAMLDQSERQTAALRRVLLAQGLGHIPVRGAICLIDTTIALVLAPNSIRGIAITTPDRLARRLTSNEALLDRKKVRLVRTVLSHGLSRAQPRLSRPTVSPTAARPTPHVRSHAGAGAPTCSCGESMVRRYRRADHSQFYGCTAFPTCRVTRKVR